MWHEETINVHETREINHITSQVPVRDLPGTTQGIPGSGSRPGSCQRSSRGQVPARYRPGTYPGTPDNPGIGQVLKCPVGQLSVSHTKLGFENTLHSRGTNLRNLDQYLFEIALFCDLPAISILKYHVSQTPSVTILVLVICYPLARGGATLTQCQNLTKE